MKKLIFIAVLLVAGCSKPTPGESAFESVEALVAQPERLKELRAQCKADHAKVGDAQCNAVAEATRQRFMRAGVSPYADDPVPAPLAPPAPASTAAPSPPAASGGGSR